MINLIMINLIHYAKIIAIYRYGSYLKKEIIGADWAGTEE